MIGNVVNRVGAGLAAMTAILAIGARLGVGGGGARAGVELPAPARDASSLPGASGAGGAGGEQTVVFAGGCFWGVQAVFERVNGVTSAVSGYAGGTVAGPSYEQVSSGDTGHAESVRVTFDPSKVTYGQLLRVFFSVVHDPTQLDRQGPDVGTQYRSAIFYTTDEQRRIAEAYIAQLGEGKTFPRPIVTQVAPLRAFYAAEAYHQRYFDTHPDQPYIIYNDAPKVAALRRQFPALYREPRRD